MRDLLQQRHAIFGGTQSSRGVTLMPYFTATPIKVLGIAGVKPYSILGANPDHYQTPILPEYYYLFDDGTGYGQSTPYFLKRIQWDYESPHRCLKMPMNSAGIHFIQQDSCCVFSTEDLFLELYEFYFDSSITLTDTFYVGWSFHNNDVTRRTIEDMFILTETRYPSITTRYHTPCFEDDTSYNGGTACYFPIFYYLSCMDSSIAEDPSNPSLQWTPLRTQEFILIYPIIEIDTTIPPAYMCDPVQNVQATADGDSCAIVTWDDFYHYTYCDVQYYAVEDSGSTVQTQTVSGTNLLRICGLDSTKTYAVRVRAYCDTSKTQTDWSPWVTFTLPHTEEPPVEGIADGESMLSFYTHLMPNPAADRVTVTSSFGLTRIEVYNLQGLLVYSEPAGFTSTTVDLRGWASGQYIMMVHTPRGVTAKKLTVRR